MWALYGFVKKKDQSRFGGFLKHLTPWVVGLLDGGLMGRSVCCNIREEKVMKKCTCIFVWIL
jgi:hypothetical protein